MNTEIKAILNKHKITLNYGVHGDEVDLKNAIIEICELQKKQCAIELEHDLDPTQAKNVAE